MKRPAGIRVLNTTLMVLTLAATMLILAPVQRAFHRNMAELHRQLVAEIEARLNRHISYSNISPSILSFLEIHDLRVHGRDEERAELLHVGRVRTHFRVRDLFGLGDPADPIIQRVVLDNSQLSLDVERDRDLIEFFQELAAPAPDSDAPRSLNGLRLDARNIQLEIKSGNDNFIAEELAFALRFGQDELNFRVSSVVGYDRFQTTATPAELRLNLPRTVRANIESEGSINPDLSSAEFDLVLNELFTPALTVRGFRFGLIYGDDQVELRNLPDQEPIDLSLVVDLLERSAELRFQAQNYNPQRTVILGDELKARAPWLVENVSGSGALSASLTISPDSDTDVVSDPEDASEVNGLAGARNLLVELFHETRVSLNYDVDLNLGLAASYSPENVFIQLQADGNEEQATVQNLQASSTYSSGRAQFQGVVNIDRQAPQGVLRFRDFRYRDSRELDGRIEIDRITQDRWNFTSDRIAYGDGVVHELSLNLTPKDEAVDVGGLFFLDELATELIEFQGKVTPDTSPDFAGTIELRNIGAASLFGLVQGVSSPSRQQTPPSQLQNLRIDSRVSLATELGELRELEAPYVSVFDTVNPDRYLSFSIFGEDDNYEVEDIFFGYGGHIVEGAIYGDLHSNGVVRYSADILYEDEAYAFSGSYDPRHGLELTSPRGLLVAVRSNSSGVYSFSADADDLMLPFLPNDSILGFDVSGELHSLQDWSLVLHEIRYTGIPTLTGPQGTVVVSGNLGPGGGTLSELRVEDSVANLVGSGSVRYGFASPFRIETSIALAGETIGERYELDIALYQGELEGELRFTQASLRRLGEPNIRGAFDGTATIQGSPTAPQLIGELQSNDGRYNNDPFFASAAYDLSPARLELSDIELRYLDSLLQADQALIDREARTVRLHGVYRHDSRRGTTEMTVGLDGLFTPNETGLVRPFEDDFRIAVRLRSSEFFNEQPDNEFELRFARNNGMVILDAGSEGELSGRLSSDGLFELRARAPFPIALQADGILQSGRIEANLNRIEISAGRIAHMLDFVEFAILDAEITGSLRIVGPINNPEFFGTLTAEQLRSRLTFTPNEITAERVYLVFQENTINMNRTAAQSGDGRAFASGRVVLNRWSPDEFRIEVQTADEGGVRISHDFDTVVVDGYGIGTLEVYGTPDLVNIGGDFTGRSTTITLSENFDPEGVPFEGETDFSVDIRVRTGRGVEFYWPTINFPLLRSFARAGEELHIQWNSINSEFSLVGAVSIQGGELYYFDRSFYIREGRIVFNEDEGGFDPLLSARAEVREISDRGPITIYMIIDNSRLSEFTPRFESSPMLPENEIAELLGGQVFGQTVGEFAALSSAVLLTGDAASQFGVMRRFETRVRDTLGLDLLSVRTPVFQNLVRGAVEDRNDDLDTQAPLLGGYLNNTSVFLGKYLGTDVFLELLLRLQAVNQFDPNTRAIGGLAVDTEFSLEFQTPFFLLEWGFFPRDIRELYVRDNTFTFSWGFSY